MEEMLRVARQGRYLTIVFEIADTDGTFSMYFKVFWIELLLNNRFPFPFHSFHQALLLLEFFEREIYFSQACLRIGFSVLGFHIPL